MKRLKIGIRPQLIILVCFSSLLSLLILAIVTGVYFSSSLSHSRIEKLEVISQLRTTQVKQSLEFSFYQVYWLTTKDTIYAPLSSYRAGNETEAVFLESQVALDQFLTSSEQFAAARLYNLDLDVVAQSFNNDTSVSHSTMDALYSLTKNQSLPSSLTTGDLNHPGYVTGPLLNSSDSNSDYFIGITFPVYANSSIILEPSISGYLSVLANAKNIQTAINDTTSSTKGAMDYTVTIVKEIYRQNDSSDADAEPLGFELVLPIKGNVMVPNHLYDIDSAPLVKEALGRNFGSSQNVKSINGDKLAIGFTRIVLNSDLSWTIIIEQPRSSFLGPVIKLRNIIIGVVIGIGVFMCLITFPLAVWFVGPITRLKEATESITKSKKRRIPANEKLGQDNSSVPPSYISINDNGGTISKRNSVNSISTNTSMSLHSTAIRLPFKIANSKKIFKDELTELSEAFNIMTEELDKQYTHLEDRVKIRTKELEALKIEAEAANEAKTVFIANISHELRTPLNGILGMTAIAMDEDDHTRIQDSLRLIYRSGELLLHILTELLTYSKNTLNRSKLEKSNFRILEIVYQVQSIFSKLAMDQRVNLNILLKPNILRKLVLFGDSNRIIQIIMNLVSNSLKFTPVDGSVDVSFKLLGEYDRISSEKDQHKKIHVFAPSRKSSGSPNSSSNNHISKENEKIIHNGENHTSLSARDISPSVSSSDKDRTFDTNNDNMSILTLSTAEYENTIFNSQFTNPKFTNLRSEHNVLPLTSNAEIQNNSLVSRERNIQDMHTNRSRTEIDKLEHDKLESIVNVNDPKRPSITSIDSNFSLKEVIKNEKVYKIKKLYEPRTWAVQIEVTDTGPGIEPSLQEKVFDPFIQGDQTLSRSYGGTGLGLSICKQLAEMMNGTLTLKSTLGEGSTFTFTVPLSQSGEVLVDDQDMAEFCEDEFNPKSKLNRKVAFDINPEYHSYLSEDADVSDLSYNTVNSINLFNEKNIDKHENVPNGRAKEDNNNKSNVRIDDFTPNSNKDTKISHKMTLDLRSLNNGTHITTPTHEHKEYGSTSPYFEKPHLLTNSSTGTANSRTSNKNEPQNSLLSHMTHLRILVVEDNKVNQEVIKRMLKLEGFSNLTMACNGAEAVEFVKESIENLDPFSLILMDVQMPKMDGLTATKMIRNTLHYEKPIIALTAFADEANVKECLNSGMSGFLAKPIRRTKLRKIITEFSPQILHEIITTPTTQLHNDTMLRSDTKQLLT